MHDQTIVRFWEDYLEKLESYGVKPEGRHWHLQGAE